MANPQLENGYTRIANELLEAFARTNFSAYQRRIIDAVMRKTYGYKKKIDHIPISQIVELTQIHKCHVSRALKELTHRNIVTRIGNKIGINKDWQSWNKLSDGVTRNQKKVTPLGLKVTQRGIKKLPDGVDSKERKKLSKENQQAPTAPTPYFTEKQINQRDHLCQTLGKRYKDIKFHQWVGQCRKSGVRPEVIIGALEKLWQQKDIKKPWPYLNHIVLIDHQNANEREIIDEHEIRKKEELAWNPKKPF